MNRSIVKWAGGKSRIMNTLRAHLPAGRRLVEPFTGSASVFLNTDYENYLLTDINGDLINLFSIAKSAPEILISEARKLFMVPDATTYYEYRTEFNLTADPLRKATLFLYLNRHCYNGLCRYNSKGAFNTPFGKYKSVYFPESEIRFFAEKAQRATFLCCDFAEALEMTVPGDVIYADPPYIPTSKTAEFTGYHTAGFSSDDQYRLAHALASTAASGCYVVASNSDTAQAAEFYAGFNISHISAPRSISCKDASEKKTGEIIASIFAPIMGGD